MRHIIHRWRWRIARYFAGVRIIEDPFPDEGGVVVMYSNARSERYRLRWILRAEKFRMKTTQKLPPLDFPKDAERFRYRPTEPYTRFVGTIGESE